MDIRYTTVLVAAALVAGSIVAGYALAAGTYLHLVVLVLLAGVGLIASAVQFRSASTGLGLLLATAAWTPLEFAFQGRTSTRAS